MINLSINGKILFSGGKMSPKNMVEEVKNLSSPLNDKNDLCPLIESFKNKKIVMLGESSHGTQEFYEWRRLITNELIQNHGFNFIAVEGDWPSCLGINKYIHGISSEDSIKVMTGFSRWPTWMWGNTEVMSLMDDLREHNEHAESPVGFYGLDVYSLYESIDEVIKLLKQIDPSLATKVQEYYSCLDPFRQDEKAYVRSLLKFPEGCEKEVTQALKSILETRMTRDADDLDVIQNARIISNAEKYYSTMISEEEDSWNIRDKHMMETLDSLLEHYGPESKAIVWAHNTHIGDYRATDMLVQGQINIGGLARQKYGIDGVALIGLTTYSGEVIASKAWDGPVEVMKVPEARDGSLEAVFHEACSGENFYLDLMKVDRDSPLNDFIGHRAIGVVYHPKFERRGNYVPTVPAKRYDALIFCDKTKALVPLNVRFNREKIPETYPFGDRV
jgi:erythromycin esterase